MAIKMKLPIESYHMRLNIFWGNSEHYTITMMATRHVHLSLCSFRSFTVTCPAITELAYSYVEFISGTRS
jgi:hypothetical protein